MFVNNHLIVEKQSLVVRVVQVAGRLRNLDQKYRSFGRFGECVVCVCVSLYSLQAI